MRKIIIKAMAMAAMVMTATSCNYREYCDDSSYRELARIHYIWEQAKAPVIPEKLNLEILDAANDKLSYITPSDYHNLDVTTGDYDAFAWNDAENVTVENRIITAAKNSDGTLKSVGPLYTGQKDFTLRSDLALQQEQEAGNTHQWNSPPYHTDANSLTVYKEVPIVMLPQTREIKITLSIDNGDIDYIKNMSGLLEGLCGSKDADGNIISSGNIHIDFVKEGDTMVGIVRVLGVDEGQNNSLSLNVDFTDGTSNPEIKVDVTNSLKNFDSDLGGKPVELECKIDIKKVEGQFKVILIDWIDVNSGDNTDLEIDD